jgi:nitrogen-specific signal transduction histidine kinase
MKELLQASVTRSVALVYRLSDADPLVEGDAAQLRQVILNLTINAAEAIGDRSGEVIISTDVRSVDRALLAMMLVQQPRSCQRCRWSSTSNQGRLCPT